MNINIPTKHRTIAGNLTNASADKILIICLGYKYPLPTLEPYGVSQILADKGYGIFTFMPSTSVNCMNLERQVEEIIAIVNHLSKPNKQIYLIGCSLGALDAVIAARKIPEKIAGIITVGGFFGKPNLYGKMLGAYSTFRSLAAVHPTYKRIWQFYKKEYQPHQITQPVLSLHSVVDNMVSIAQSLDFFKRLTVQKDFIVLKHSDHELFVEAEHQNIADSIDRWLTA